MSEMSETMSDGRKRRRSASDVDAEFDEDSVVSGIYASAQPSPISVSSSRWYRRIDLNKLTNALKVEARELRHTCLPEFVTKAWLVTAMNIVRNNIVKSDRSGVQVPPIGLIIRRGENLALLEIDRAAKATMDNTAVIYVNFYDIRGDRRGDLVSALCRQIAFAALEDQSVTFCDFESRVEVTESDIITWLGNQPCLLLIDRLHVATLDASEDSKKELFSFLRKHFLIKPNRYFVFSSHVESIIRDVDAYLDSKSHSEIKALELPLNPETKEFESTRALGLRESSSLGLIYNAFIPGLLLKSDGVFLPEQELVWDLLNFVSKLNDDGIVQLMASYIDGNRWNVFPELLAFLSTGEQGKIQWIVRHMELLLQMFESCNRISKWIRDIIGAIRNNFGYIAGARYHDTRSWEILFATTLLVRLLCRRCDGVIMPSFEGNYVVSYNSVHIFGYGQRAQTLDSLLGEMTKPAQFPHIAVFYPTQVIFRPYDVLVIEFKNAVAEPCIIGYSLTKGRVGPPKACPDDQCMKRIFIRGNAQASRRSKHEDRTNDWIVPSKAEIENFLGESGVQWTPDAWSKIYKKNLFDKSSVLLNLSSCEENEWC